MKYLTDNELADALKKAGVTASDAQEAANGIKNTSITILFVTKRITRTVHNGIVSLKYGCPFQKAALKSLILTNLLPEGEEAYGVDLGEGFFAKWSRDTSNLVGGLSFKLPDEIKKSESKEEKPSVDDDDEEL